MSQSLFARLSQRYEPQSQLDRREFLKRALAATTGLLISASDGWSARPSPRRGTRRFVVIGAGFSGLACAHELKSAGHHVTVLESRNRVGGRVLTFGNLVKGKSVEGGGEFIGTNHPTWLAYSKKFGLKLFVSGEDENADQPLLLEGKRLSAKEAKALFEEMKVLNKHMTSDAVSVNADEPWNTQGAAELDHKSLGHWLRDVSASRLCKLAFGSQLASNNAAPLNDQSYLGNLALVKGGGLEKYWTDSETLHCRGGNQGLAEKLAHALGANIHMETPVTHITTTNTSVSVRAASGEMFEGDDVIVAVPPSVWHRIKIEPALPHALRPQMGTAVKYMSVVNSRFWQDGHLGPNAASDGMLAMTWDATAAQPGREAVLMAFSGGPAAKICRKRWSRNGSIAFREELQKFYPEYQKHFVKSAFMDWPSDQWTQAGYSFPAPGQVTAMGPILRSGIGRLHFAGEHACYKFVGYMEGALNSGVALARRLVMESKRSVAA